MDKRSKDKAVRMSFESRGKVALAAYEAAYGGTESFEEGTVGADLAYLMGAILKGDSCEWPPERKIVQIMKTRLKGKTRAAILAHITLDKEG